MILKTKLEKLFQMDISDWPKSNYESVASVDLSPVYLKESKGIIFYDTEEQLGVVSTAYLKYDDLYFQLMLLTLEPSAGMYLNIDNSLLATSPEIINKILHLLSIDDLKVLWRN